MKKKKKKKKERKKERKKESGRRRNRKKEKKRKRRTIPVVQPLLCRMQSVVDHMDSQRRETRQEDCLIGPMRRKSLRFVETREQ